MPTAQSLPIAEAERMAALWEWQGYDVEFRDVVDLSNPTIGALVIIARSKRPTSIWEWICTDGIWYKELAPREKFARFGDDEPTCDECGGELDIEGDCEDRCYIWEDTG